MDTSYQKSGELLLPSDIAQQQKRKEQDKNTSFEERVVAKMKEIEEHTLVAEEAQRRIDEKKYVEKFEKIYDLLNQPEKPPKAFKEYSKEEQIWIQRDKRIHAEDIRPKKFEEIIGQSDAIESTLSLLASSHPPHMLFIGPPGVGKTTVAKLALDYVSKQPNSRFSEDAPFIEVSGSTMGADEYNRMNPLIATVNAITYRGVSDRQEARGLKNLPEIILGACSLAHLGVLFIDEIGELTPWSINSLLKILEDHKDILNKRELATTKALIPSWVQDFFDNGIPADFVLIGATTRQVSELPPALISRCEIIQFKELSEDHLVHIAKNVAEKFHVSLNPGVAISMAKSSRSGREIVRSVIIASGKAERDGRCAITLQDIAHKNTAKKIGFR